MNERKKFSKAQEDALVCIQITGRRPETRDTRTVQILEERGAYKRDKTGRYRATEPSLLRAHPQLAAYNRLKREGWEHLSKPYFYEDFKREDLDSHEFGIAMERDPEACLIRRDGRVLLMTGRHGEAIGTRSIERSIEIEERKDHRLIHPPFKAETGEEIFRDMRKALDALVETRELVTAAGPQKWSPPQDLWSDKSVARSQHLRRVAKLEDIIDELQELADVLHERLPEYIKAPLRRKA